MTKKYESVLSEADKVNLIRDHEDIANLVDRTEQATLSKLQPQLDAIGAGGVSGRVMRVVTPTSLVDVDFAIALYQVVEKELLDIEMCFENFDTPQQAINDLIEWHMSDSGIPEGYKLVPIDISVKKDPDWYVSEDGRNLFCMDFTHDVKLTLDGDFDNENQRLDYAKKLVVRLNGAPIVGAIDPFKTSDTE